MENEFNKSVSLHSHVCLGEGNLLFSIIILYLEKGSREDKYVYIKLIKSQTVNFKLEETKKIFIDLEI